MSIKEKRKQLPSGVTEITYTVSAEAINKVTGKRVQKKESGITSRLKADRRYRELWLECRESNPYELNILLWKELKLSYLEYVESQKRSPEKPLGFSPHTYENKVSRLKRLDEWDETPLAAITPFKLTDLLDKFEKDGKASRVLTREVQKEARCMFTYAVNRGILKVNPLGEMAKRVVPKKRKQAFNHTEVDTLLFQARARNHRYYLIWLLSIAIGFRRSELAGLKWTDIDFDSALVHIQRQKHPGGEIVEYPKGLKDRISSIPKQILPVLKAYKLRATSEFVIELDCKFWDRGHQSMVLRAFCKEIGIKELVHHRLRATHITLALIDGVSLGAVKENVGHVKLSTTDDYFSSTGIEMKGQTDKLRINVPPIDGGTLHQLVGQN